MSAVSRESRSWAFPVVAAALAVSAVELGLNPSADGTFLLVLTFWTMVFQGCVAVAAVGELSKGIWMIPVKRELLAVNPLVLVSALLSLVMWTRMDIYHWNSPGVLDGRPVLASVWLDRNLFVARHFVVLVLTFLAGRNLTRAVANGSRKSTTHAVIYVAMFIISQSLIAFDWIMSLEYPWITTLFGGHFFVQAFLMGLLFTVYVIAPRMWAGDTELTETLRDTGKMIFGFCFLWGGFLFTHYLVIWYGNIPEEVAFVLKRVEPSPYWGLSRVALAMIFAIPFVTLLSRKVKTKPLGMFLIASSVAVGLFIEKIILITPVVSVKPLPLVIEFALMMAALILTVRRKDSFIPALVAPAWLPRNRREEAAGFAAVPRH